MALVTPQHVRWREPISVRFGFTGINAEEAAALVRSRLKAQFPDLDKPEQCVYVVRLKGDVAIAYGDDFSPAIYIGEGNAATRLHSHANWIAELLVAVPNAEIEVRVADCVRTNDTSLCQYVEADLLAAFAAKYKCLPWFNRQRERSTREGESTTTLSDWSSTSASGRCKAAGISGRFGQRATMTSLTLTQLAARVTPNPSLERRPHEAWHPGAAQGSRRLHRPARRQGATPRGAPQLER